jgi:predicted nucleic acid-binding protein
MKALDTPILLRLLRGEPGVRALIRSLGGEELATTEWNMLELEMLANADSSPGRERRRGALEKLRRRVTVVPVDERAIRSIAAGRARARTPGEMISLGIMGALESRGCSVLYTSRSSPWPTLRSKLRIEMVR